MRLRSTHGDDSPSLRAQFRLHPECPSTQQAEPQRWRHDRKSRMHTAAEHDVLEKHVKAAIDMD